MIPPLPLVTGLASTVELTIPANVNVRVLPLPPKVALAAPPLAEKPPVVEYVTASASAGVTVMNASTDKANTMNKVLRVIFPCPPFLVACQLHRPTSAMG